MKNEKREKVLLFYNPNSGDGLFKNYLDRIIERFQAKDLQVIPIRAARDNTIEQALAEIKEEEYRQIVVAGGDGTINVCVNTMIHNDIHLPLAIFPTGTANDFSYYFEISDEVETMIDVAMGDRITTADVGVCNDRYFINVAALGSLVDVSQKTDPNLKNSLGVFSYYLKAMTELVNLKPIPIKLETEETTYEEEMYFMLVMNGESAGGFKQISPESLINDGKLDVILFKKMPIIELAPLFVNVLQGNHVSHKKVIYFQTDKMRITSPITVSTDIDGEEGLELPLEFSVLHNRLKIFTPEGADL